MSELSEEAKALIRRVGTADGPGPVDRARVKRRIVAGFAGAGMVFGGGSTIASGAPAGAVGLAVGKVKIASVALWLAAGAGLGTVASAPAVVSAYRRAESFRASVSAPDPARPPARAEQAPVNASPALPAERSDAGVRAPSPEGEGRRLNQAAVNEAPPSQAPVNEAPPAAPGSDDVARTSPGAISEPPGAERPRAAPSVAAASLAEEMRLLEAAQRDLAQKRTAAALALLDEHAAKFPRGALAQERAGARILALCDLGRVAEARSAAAAFTQSSPSSPLVPRLRASCAGTESPSGDFAASARPGASKE